MRVSKSPRKTFLVKIKRKIRFKPKIELSKIKLKSPKFNFFKKISFQGTVEWLLNPFFKGWDHYLERKRARKIAQMEFERKEKIRLKKEESRLRLEAKKKALQDIQNDPKMRDPETKAALMKRKDKFYDDLNDLSGLSKNHPVISFSLLILLFSLAGIPPMAGFFAKFYIFISVIEESMYFLAIVGLLSTVVSAFYYLK